ncbi:MAG: cation transporter [Ruminococcaceae bacterium]|nr:cation transporter [Oscillospiraceae bacterium]
MIEKLIKDYNNRENPLVRVRVGRFAGFVGIFANLVLFAIKLVFGLLFGSISIIADSLNNLSDSGSNILTVVGYTISGKPADKDHPYGHARMEYLASLFISIIVTFLGFEMLTTSIEKLTGNPTAQSYDKVAIIVMASTIIVKIIVAIMNFKLGKHIDSKALKATAIDSISDVIATSAVVVGMIITPYTGPYTDGIIGIVIAIYIMVMGVKLVIESSNTLIGEAPDASFTHEIIKKIKSYEGVLGIHDLVIHSYGANRCFATVHVEIDADGEIMHSHDLMDNIEADFLKNEGINLVIHMDPISVSDPETNELRQKCLEMVSAISQEYSHPVSMHDFRIVKGVTHTNVLFDVSITDEFVLTNDELCNELSNRIKEINPLYHLVLTIDRDYFSERYGEE